MPSTMTRRQSPPTQFGAALAGSRAAPKPWKASVASRRMPSISAWGTSVMPVGRGLLVEHVAEAGALGLEQDRVGGRCRPASRARGRPAGGRAGVTRVGSSSKSCSVATSGSSTGQVHDGEVEPAADQLGQQRRGGGVDDDEVHLGMALGHGHEQGRDEPAGGGADDARGGRCRTTSSCSEATSAGQGVELGLDLAGPGRRRPRPPR